MAQYDVDLRDYWRILRKRRASILFMVLLVGLGSYGFAKFREPAALYEATAAIKIDRFSNLASILTGGYWRQAENMETHAYIVTSHPVLREAVAALGWPGAGMADDAPALLASMERLKKSVEARTQEGAHIIVLRAVADSPAEAAAIANALARAYRDYNIQQANKRTFETRAFIEEQLRRTGDRLREAEAALQRFREEHGVLALDAQTANTLNRIHGLELEHERAKGERRAIEAALRALDSPRGDPAQAAVLTAPSTPALEPLRARLSELNLKRQGLLTTLTEKHPQVEELTAQIRAAGAEVRRELAALLQVAAAREADLGDRLERLRRDNADLPEKGLLLSRLQREVDLQQSLYGQLKSKHQEVLIQESGKLEEVSIVRPALPPEKPFNIPSKAMIVLTGLVMGVVLGIVVAFLAEVFDTSIGTIEDVESLLQVPVLGVIPHLEAPGRSRPGEAEAEARAARNRSGDLVTHHEPKSQGAEAFRALRANLQFLRLEVKGKLFLVTSAFVQEGKTLNAVNLALSLAQAGNRVLLIDADLRKPNVHRVFGLPRSPGLSDYVLGDYRREEVVGTISDVLLGEFEIEEVLKTPGMDNLHTIPAGTKPPNPTELLSSERFRELLQEAKQTYDFILVDAPPVLPVADATEIAPLMDGVLLVYTVDRIGRGVLKRAKSTLDNVEARVLGVILNNVKPEAGPDYFRYHSHYYYGAESPPAAQPKRLRLPRLSGPAPFAKAFGAAAAAVLLCGAVLGILGEDLREALPEGLKPWLSWFAPP